MRTPLDHPKSIWERLTACDDRSSRFLRGATASICLEDLLNGSIFHGQLHELSGRTVLIATHDQLVAALALIELDGVANRMIVCPPDVSSEHIPGLIAKGGVDTILTDHPMQLAAGLNTVICGATIESVAKDRPEFRPTEWVLLTSGTTGAPKMIVHNFATLTGPIDMSQDHMRREDVVWGTFYDIRRYGGMQIFLRGILGNGSVVLSSAGEPVADHLERLGSHGVTHLSGTPSHWRRTLMSPAAHRIAPGYIRLSGEIADQAVLSALQSAYPNSAVGHAFASTEAGVAFEVNDGLAGFPASMLGKRGDVEMRIANGCLQIRSNRCASRYLDAESGALADAEGFVDTGDVVELRDGRYHFLGRRNGVINVGGLKVYPEEVEAVINRHPAVRVSMVRSRKNPFTGALVSADVVLSESSNGEAPADLKTEILDFCRRSLPPHKVPASIRYVRSLEVAAAGKLARPSLNADA